MMMTKIYIFAIYTHQKSYIQDAEDCGDTIGVAMDENLNVIANHFSSGICWTMHDMGITSGWKRDIYKNNYPDGYELVWMGGFESGEDAENEIKKLKQEAGR